MLLLPRALSLGEDPELVKHLMLVEDAWREWRNELKAINDLYDFGYPEEYVWTSFLSFAKALQDLDVLTRVEEQTTNT